MRFIRIFTGLVGLGATLLAVPMVAAGIGLFAWAGTGSTTTLPSVLVDTDSRVLIAEDIDVFAGERHTRLPSIDRVSVAFHDDRPLFVGLGDPEEVARFVADGAIDPAGQDFWAYSAEGSAAVLDVDMEPGTWTAVVMNADGSAGIDATVAVTVPSTPLRAAGAVIAVLGVGTGLVGVLLALAAWGSGRSVTRANPTVVTT